jgi:hypothetical protein
MAPVKAAMAAMCGAMAARAVVAEAAHVSHMPSEASGEDAMDVAALRGRERWGVLVVRTVTGKAGAGGSKASGLAMGSVTASRVRLTTPGAYDDTYVPVRCRVAPCRLPAVGMRPVSWGVLGKD